MKTFYYIIDGLAPKEYSRFKRAMFSVKGVMGVFFRADQSIVKVEFIGKDPIEHVEMAAGIVGASVRKRISEKEVK